jgi:SET domain-containing protein
VVVFFAKRDIKCGEELFFDYDGTGMLEKNHKEKYPFIKKK